MLTNPLHFDQSFDRRFDQSAADVVVFCAADTTEPAIAGSASASKDY